MNHYHVLLGLQGGYLPDHDEVYRTRDAALAAAQQLVEWTRGDPECVIHELETGLWALEPLPHRITTLESYIKVTECNAAKCLCTKCGDPLSDCGRCETCSVLEHMLAVQ